MNIILINLEMITEDHMMGLDHILRKDKFTLVTYWESHDHPIKKIDGSLIINDMIQLNHSKVNTVIAIAPGYETLKSIHDMIIEYGHGKAKMISIIISLPDQWTINKSEKSNRMQYEGIYTYLSSMIPLAYPRLTISCLTADGAEYYAKKLLGGFYPLVKSVNELLQPLIP